MSTIGKIYLGDILVSDPSASGGSTVEYVTFTFSGGNKFCVSALTDNGYVNTTLNGSGSINVVKNSIVLVGKMKASLSNYTTPSNLTCPVINGLDVGKSPFSTNSPTSSSGFTWNYLLAVVADQDITFYADVD